MATLEMNGVHSTVTEFPLLKTLPLAILAHALLIFGVSFVPNQSGERRLPAVLDITLVQTHSEKSPDEAKFIAQANQQASGTTDQENRPRTPLAAVEPNTSDGDAPIQAQKTAPETPPKYQPQILTTKGETFKAADKTPEQPDDQPDTIDKDLSDTSLEIAQLLAEVDEAEARYARRPRIHFIDAVSAKSAVEAEYVDSWVKKIERIGNINFPEEAVKRNLSGKLIVNVTLDHNGRVVDTQIDVSSGFTVLDKAAERIVRLASPYPPLPKEIRQKWDQLNITRTWIFHSGTLNTE